MIVECSWNVYQQHLIRYSNAAAVSDHFIGRSEKQLDLENNKVEGSLELFLYNAYIFCYMVVGWLSDNDDENSGDRDVNGDNHNEKDYYHVIFFIIDSVIIAIITIIIVIIANHHNVEHYRDIHIKIDKNS